MNHDEQTRNECSSHSGGFHLFGFGYDESETKCSGSLEDTTQGQNTAVLRFTSRSYGTLPQVYKKSLGLYLLIQIYKLLRWNKGSFLPTWLLPKICLFVLNFNQ